MASTQLQLTLYDHPVSSYAQTIRVLLREKSLPFTQLFPLDPSQPPPPRFLEISPHGEVPCLDHMLPDGQKQAIFESSIIAEYLDDAFPDTPAMLPPRQDAMGRAHVRMVSHMANTSYEAINWGWGELDWFGRAEGQPREQELVEHMRQETVRQTELLWGWLEERLLPVTAGAAEGTAGGTEQGTAEQDFYFGGRHGFGYADAAAFVMVNRSAYYGWQPAEGSKLARWFARCGERPAVRAMLAEHDEVVGEVPKAKELFLSGKWRRQFRDHRLEWLVKSGGIGMVNKGLEDGLVRFNWPEGRQF